jgi:L-fuculose-phosphate aldolase
MSLKELRRAVLDTALAMLEDGVAHGSQGNISALDRDSGLIAITPSALPYTELKPKDICLVDKQGKVVEGPWRPTTELLLHLIFYQRRQDVGAVVHTHAPYTSVFGICNTPLPMALSEAAMHLGETVPVAPYARPGSQELAEATLAAMGDHGLAAIMANHGLVTVGDSLERAYESTLAAENTACLVMMAKSMGGKVTVLPQSEVDIIRQTFLEKYHADKLEK